jgi:hypothetical protein
MQNIAEGGPGVAPDDHLDLKKGLVH